MDSAQNFEALLKQTFTPREWLTYYRNIWNKNMIATIVDIQVDTTLKSVNPDEQVEGDRDRMGNIMYVPVKQRLEERKLQTEIALRVIRAIDALLALSDEEIENRWSPEATAVAPDMMPEPQAATEVPEHTHFKDEATKEAEDAHDAASTKE